MSIVIVDILQNWLENNYAIPAKPNFRIKKTFVLQESLRL